jgi:hypothetical protein
VKPSANGRVVGACSCPTVSAGIVPRAGVKNVRQVNPAPDNHFTADPDCCVIDSAIRRISEAGSCPRIRARIISSASMQKDGAFTYPAPDDHFTARPDCGVKGSRNRCGGDACGCPRIGARIISSASIQKEGVFV